MKYILILFFTLNIYETYAQEVTEKQYKHIMSICSDVTSFVNNNNGDLKRINKKTFIYNSINDTKTCPDNCITNKYLIANDVVLAGIQYKNFTCFMYKINDSKYISGWVKTGDLSSIKNRKYVDKELSGNWISDDEYRYLNIDLKIINEKLHMLGSSSFKFNNDNNLRNYNFDGILEYDSGIYKIKSENPICEYKFYRYGAYLSVIDLGKCLPGSEFSLSGIYKKDNN